MTTRSRCSIRCTRTSKAFGSSGWRRRHGSLSCVRGPADVAEFLDRTVPHDFITL